MSTATGRAAERAAAIFLRAKGYDIVAQNWRTRWCEIDIVATKNGAIYLVEVKYRASQAWGSGFDYLTPQKLQQMRFAAEFWQASHGSGHDYYLSAVELTGQPPRVATFIDDIT